MYLRLLLITFIFSLILSWSFILFIVFSLNSSEKYSESVRPESSESSSVSHYINSTNWDFGSFLINNSNKCKNDAKSVKLLVLIHSSVTHFEFRQLIRKYNKIKNSINIFLIGLLDDPGLQRLIEQESNQFGDIVQGSFQDSYHNLTLKHIMGLTWSLKYCSSAQMVLKMDDDVFVNYRLLDQLLKWRYPEYKSDPLVSRTNHKLIAGYIQHKMKVIRNTTSRWYVSKSTYQHSIYPDFLSGWAYITTVEVISDLLDQIASHPLFWIDDVYITGILRQSLPDIELESLNKFFNVDVSHLYHWVSDRSFHNYKWRYVFSNANGDLNLLSTALSINDMNEEKICCYPTANDLLKERNSIEFKPKSIKGSVKQMSL